MIQFNFKENSLEFTTGVLNWLNIYVSAFSDSYPEPNHNSIIKLFFDINIMHVNWLKQAEKFPTKN